MFVNRVGIGLSSSGSSLTAGGCGRGRRGGGAALGRLRLVNGTRSGRVGLEEIDIASDWGDDGGGEERR